MMQWTLRFCISFVTATRFIVHRTSESLTWKSNLHRVKLPLHRQTKYQRRVGNNNRADENTVTEKYEEEIDDEGFITVRTKKTKREMKRSKTVTWKDIESKKCKSVSRAILLKQSS
jgi:hypothetical protein